MSVRQKLSPWGKTRVWLLPLFLLKRPMDKAISAPAMPDSASPEYYYLIQQESRLLFLEELGKCPTVEASQALGKITRLLVYLIRLWVVTVLVRSYVNEVQLLELTGKSAHG